MGSKMLELEVQNEFYGDVHFDEMNPQNSYISSANNIKSTDFDDYLFRTFDLLLNEIRPIFQYMSYIYNCYS